MGLSRDGRPGALVSRRNAGYNDGIVSAANADDPLIGQVLDGKYRLVSRLGAGGMGKVYRAEQVALNRSVAVKVLDASPNHRDADPAVERRFFLEASLSAKLSHANVITVHDYGRVDTAEGPQFYLVMELLEGQTLHQRLQRGPTPMKASEAISVGIEIARGLRAAHKAGLVHRDLKPANVMLVAGDEGSPGVKILDFGLVKQLEGELREDITQEGTFLGSPRYMAPEQVSAAPVDHRCDLYALGIILYQCLVGRTPFDGKAPMEVLVKHVSTPVPAMRDVNPAIDIAPPLESLVRRLLEKSPDARYADADAVLNALRGIATLPAFREDVTVASRSQSGAMRFDAPGPSTPALVAPSPNEQSGTIAGATITATSTTGVPEKKRAPVPLIAGGLALLVVGVGGAAIGLRGNGSRGAANQQSETSRAPERPSSTDRGSVAPASRGVLRIESTPAGASVREAGLVLGVTPLSIEMNSEGAARRFEVQHPGFATYVFEQAPTAERVIRVAALTAEAAAEPASPTRRPRTNANRRPSNQTGAAQPADNPGEQIRLER